LISMEATKDSFWHFLEIQGVLLAVAELDVVGVDLARNEQAIGEGAHTGHVHSTGPERCSVSVPRTISLVAISMFTSATYASITAQVRGPTGISNSPLLSSVGVAVPSLKPIAHFKLLPFSFRSNSD